MKKRFSLFFTFAFALLLLCACGPGKDKVRIEGSFANINDAEFYVYSEDGAFEGLDTIKISDGKFSYERKLTTPTVLTLLYPNFTQTYLIGEPGHTIKIKGEASKIGEAEVKGTEQNELLSDFRIKHNNDAPSNLKLAAAQFVRENPQMLAAVAVFRKYFVNVKKPDAALGNSLLDLLRKAQPKERAISNLEAAFRPLLKAASGEKLPTFTAKAIDGRVVSSDAYKGKNVIIAFTATWQTDSRPLMMQLRRQLRQRGSKWQLLVVSLDTNRKALDSSLRTDSISCPVICDTRAFDSPVVKTLGVHYVPSLMMVNAQGLIVQRDITNIDDIVW